MIILYPLLLACLALQPTQEDPIQEPPPGTPEGPPPLELSLEQAIIECFSNNLVLKGARLDTQGAVAGFGAAWGDFDTEFFTTVLNQRTVTAPTPVNFVGGVDVGASPKTEFELFQVRSGVRGMLTTGTSWQFDIGPSYAKTEVEDGSPSRNRTNTADWSLSLTQPLLRNGADDFATSGLELAAKDVSLSTIAAKSLAYTTIVDVITAYWNLVYARQNLDTIQLSVDLANELLDITQRKYQQGIQNRIDVIEVEADLARREEELLTAHNAVVQAVDDLRKLVFAPESQGEWGRDIVPSTDYEQIPEGEVDTDAAIQDAIRLRPDIESARLTFERAAIEVRRAENQARSRLDVTGAYGLNSNETNKRDAVYRLNNTEFYEARVFVDFAVSIGNRTAGYTLRRRKLDRDRANVTLRDTEVQAVSEVRSSARDVELQSLRVKATEETTRLRLEVYEGEKRRLENDLSTPFQVRESQRDYLQAVDDETRARLDLAVAQTNLLASRGKLLVHYGLSAEPPETSLEEAPPAP